MNQQRDLEGIGALVTGATSGTGRAAAEELGRHGAEVRAACPYDLGVGDLQFGLHLNE